ncbi:MAG TPA: 3-methyl-2-oxobutanoate hydroxymethyltransferase [Myxococcales bacterium]|nr:3-methyl-2-oxobutanoate hydroxymethyltransferase [Myxococcales bacterium]
MKKVTIHTLRKMKQAGERITMLTAYDASFARLLDQAQIDVLLVGDSLGMVVQGHDTTLPVTMDQMVYHCAAVARGTKRAHLVGDMPFGSYQASPDEAVKNAVRLVAEGGAEAVKLEGGADYTEVIARIVRAGVPVMGHIGLTPQSVHKMGGYVVQGRGEEKAARLLADARALEKAGCYSLILEAIPAQLAGQITRSVSIPTIGIGAGIDCDGQVLVLYDLLGMNPEFSPKFVKKYANLAEVIGDAAARYRDEVRVGAFPGEDHSFTSEKPAAPGKPAAVAPIMPLPLPTNGEERPTKLYSVPARD